jgi:hypothetical protein
MWQRFLLASSLLFGLLVGVAATVFAYSNKASVDVSWLVLHLYGIPLWTVAVVPVALVLIAGTLYHWYRSLYHFTEHMRHRHRVHELEAELATMRAQMDGLLEMPDQAAPSLPARHIEAEPEEVKPEPLAADGDAKLDRKAMSRKRVSLTPGGSNGRTETEPNQVPIQET